MLTITSLSLPILLSTALVWLAAALIWTVLPWHKNDCSALPDEDSALAALRPQNIAPGQYNFPHLTSSADIKEAGVRQKFEDGPAGFMTVLPRGAPAMGKNLVLSVVYYLLVSLVVAYLASRTLSAGEDYLHVFRVTSTIAWLAYGAAIIPDSIWFGRPWSGAIKSLGDALVYGLLTGGAFGALWPAIG